MVLLRYTSSLSNQIDASLRRRICRHILLRVVVFFFLFCLDRTRPDSTHHLKPQIEEIHRRFPGTWDRIYLSGFSLGGNVIVKFLGEQVCGAAKRMVDRCCNLVPPGAPWLVAVRPILSVRL